jgi:hypothetical protein
MSVSNNINSSSSSNIKSSKKRNVSEIAMSSNAETEENDEIFPLQNMDRIDKSLWLVKLPPYICELWATAADDQALGKFHIRKGAGGKREFVVRLEAGDANVPTDLVIAEVPRAQNASEESILAFSNDEKQRKFSAEGRVTKRFVLRPENMRDASIMLRQRSLAELAKKKSIEIKDVDRLTQMENFSMTIDLTMHESRQAFRSRALASGMASMSHEEKIRSCIFDAFEKEEYLKFEDLYRACQGIEGFHDRNELKAVLAQFTIFNRQGPQRHHYELKEHCKIAKV